MTTKKILEGKFLRSPIVLASMIAIACQIARSGEVCTDCIWVPHAVSMTITGEAKSDTEEPFLVAGSNATAKIVVEDFAHDWQSYATNYVKGFWEDRIGRHEIRVGLSGRFRHKLERIIITGYAASEFGITSEQLTIGLGARGIQGDIVGRNWLFGNWESWESTGDKVGDYTTAAKEDLNFTYHILPVSENSDTYKIDNVQFPDVPKNTPPLAIAKQLLHVTGGNGEFELPIVLPTGPRRHGAFYWTATVIYEIEGTFNYVEYDEYGDVNFEDHYAFRKNNVEGPACRGKSTTRTSSTSSEDITEYNDYEERYGIPSDPRLHPSWLSTSLRQILLIDDTDGKDGWVFFDKYGKDDKDTGYPNWFTYWKEDGACPSLMSYAGKIVYGGTGADYGEWKPESKLVHLAANVKFREGVDCIGPAAFHYPDGLEFTHKTFPSQSYKFPEKGGGTIYGIYTVEEVVMHELFHEKLDRLYYELYHSGNFISSLAGILDSDSDRKNEPYVWERCYVYDNGICVSGDCASRPWCDYLVDYEENWFWGPFSEFNLDMYDTDTYKLKTKNPEYGAYGDNEFLCMIEANKASRRTVEEGGADPSKDWAFPGEQSYRPTLPPKQNENIAVNEPTSGQRVISLIGLTSTSDRETDGLVSSICYSLEMQSSGFDESNELKICATLTDRSGVPAAFAYAYVPASAGSSVAAFRFNGADVYESGLSGPFKIGNIVISEFDGNDSVEIVTLSEFQDSEVDLRREDFTRNDAYLLEVADESVSTNGIVVSVNMDVHAAGEYGIVAALVNTNGASVASSSIVTNCVQGTNCIDMVFAASDIFQSRIDGPYVIGNIALYKDGVRVDSRLDFYTTRKVYRRIAFYFDEEDEFDSAEFMEQFEDYMPPAEATPPEWFWVFFNPNGGEVSESLREVNDGDKVGTLPTPIKENDEFLGWYTELEGGTRISDSTVITTNVMCHARWKNGGTPTQQVWTVSLNPNGGAFGEGVENTMRFAKGKAIGADGVRALPVPTREGYSFGGWWTAKTKGTKITASTKVTKDVTWYARWTVRKYKVAAAVSAKAAGTVSGAGSKAYGSKVTLKATPKKGYVFVRWVNLADEETPWPSAVKYRQPSVTFTVPAANVSVKAVFAKASADVVPVLTVEFTSDWYVESEPSREIAVAAESLSYPTVTLSGAPAGVGLVRVPDTDCAYVLKVTDAAKVKPGVYTAKITAKNRAGKSVAKSVKIVAPNSSAALAAGLMAGLETSTLSPYVAPGGMKTRWPLSDLGVEVFATNGWKLVSVTGLPTGLSWNGSAIVGAASKTGLYTVTFKMQKTVGSGKKAKTYTSTASATFKVEALLPAALAGTYNGFANTTFNVPDEGDDGEYGGEGEDNDEETHGIYAPLVDGWASAAKVTVTTAGKITANVGGATLSGAGFDSVSNGVYSVKLKKTQKIAKGSLKGKTKVWEAYLEIDTNAAWDATQLVGWYQTYTTGLPSMTAPMWVVAQRGAFASNDDAKAIASVVSKFGTKGVAKFKTMSVKGQDYNYDLVPGTGLAATAKANGTVTLAGKIGSVKVSGTATLEVSGTGTATARFFTSKFVVEVVYVLEDGAVVSASGKVWKK